MDAQLKQLEGHVRTGNVEAGAAVLRQLKVAATTARDDAALRRALELGVLLSVGAADLDLFQRNMAQVRPLLSPDSYHMIGLLLMHLLVDNRLSEFHSELELLSERQLQNPLIQFPVQLEQKMMVGIYDEVLGSQVPDPSYQFFMDQLVQTVRDSIADCMEVSYRQLTLQQAADQMKCGGARDVLEYIRTVRDDWIVDESSGTITFQPGTEATPASATDIPSMQWIQQSLAYATEMERIV